MRMFSAVHNPVILNCQSLHWSYSSNRPSSIAAPRTAPCSGVDESHVALWAAAALLHLTKSAQVRKVAI